MLTWIPIIGPIIQGIISIFTKKMDTTVQLTKIERDADTEEAKVSEHIIRDTQDDIGLRLMRDLICAPVVIWFGIIGWDTIISARQSGGHGILFHPSLEPYIFTVANYPESVAYLPYAVMVFL